MRNYRLYHIPLFLFGAFYYWIFPLIILKSGIIEDMPGIDLLEKYDYKNIGIIYYLLVGFLIVSFVAGSLLPLYFRRAKMPIKVSPNITNSKIILLIAIPFFLYGQILVFKARAYLFHGYTATHSPEIMGGLATLNSVLLILYLISSQLRNSKCIAVFLFFIFEFSIVLLGLGTRMYVLVPLIAIGLNYIENHKISYKFILNGVIAICLLLLVGIWRISGDNFDIKWMFYIGSAEPVFTWISVISYFECNDIPLLSTPINFLSSFINMIPTMLLPWKSNLLIEINANYDSPLGATSMFLSILYNFGVVGSSIMLFIAGAILTTIRFNWRSALGNAYYYCICGIIPFQLFRDNFAIVNKMIFFNFLIIPLIVITVIKLLNLNYKYEKPYS